jgi:AGZA family xanthine/uracil permease-like MFS transporter
MNFQDILVAVLSLLDVASGAVLALSFGFLLLPSAAGFIVGGLGSLLSGSVTPVSFQQENLALSVSLSKDMKARISMILGAALLTGLLGILGLPQLIVDTVGREIFLGMLAGVGLYLTMVGFDLAKGDWLIGLPCLVVALVIQLWTNDLVWAVATSVPLGVIIRLVRPRSSGESQETEIEVPEYASWMEAVRAEFKLFQPVVNSSVVIGALAISTLTLGGNIAYTAVNLEMSGMTGTYNAVSVISGIADFFSSLFGGAPMEVIVSATAAAPHPIVSGILLMFGAAILLLSGLIYKIARYIPIPAMGGYLVAIGAVLVFPYNAIDAFAAGDPVVVALTMGATVATNPFYGLLMGLVAKIVMGWLGVL